MSISEIFISFFSLLGAFFIMVAGLGVWKFKDLYMRMHAATKAGSLGLGLFLVAIAILHPELSTILKCVAIIGFIFLTAPIAAHMIGRAAYLHKTSLWDKTRSDALQGKYSKDHSRLDS